MDTPVELSQDQEINAAMAAALILEAADGGQVEAGLYVGCEIALDGEQKGYRYADTIEAVVSHGNHAEMFKFVDRSEPGNPRDYVIACAYALFQNRRALEFIRCRMLNPWGTADNFTVSREDAWRSVVKIVSARMNPERKPHLCAFCNKCKARTRCPIVGGLAAAVGYRHAGYQGDFPVPLDPAALEDPEAVSMLLDLAQAVSGWSHDVHRAIAQRAADGLSVPGYKLVRAGSRVIVDIGLAASRLEEPALLFHTGGNEGEMPVAEFCELYAEVTGLTFEGASRLIEQRLADLIVGGPPDQDAMMPA